MYAVIKTGGKQHKVQAGDVIEVEKLVGPDETLTFTPLLVVDDAGKTFAGAAASKATVTAKAVGEAKGDKVKVSSGPRSFSTSITSPACTLCCLPPVLMTAYMGRSFQSTS